MAEIVELGRLETIPPRDIWPHEAHHFTQWLLQNADVLSEVLGMDLELTAAEHPVGGFSLDLIGKDLANGEVVIIENQLEMTDHSHLGQLLTYAGGTDPVSIVWCAPSFREEHRAALDWLNVRTDENTRFFGVELGAVRIDASRAAPLFRLVVKPNDWAKRVHTEAGNTVAAGPKQQAYSAFWESLFERIRTERPSWTSASRAPAQSWITLPFGTSKIWYGMSFTVHGLSVELYFGSADAEENTVEYLKYEAKREEIESAFGEELSFQPLPERKACRIAAYGGPADVLNSDDLGRYEDWFMDSFERFRSAIESLRL